MRMLITVLAMYLLAGCAMIAGPGRQAQVEPKELMIGDVIDTETGKILSLDQLVDKLLPAAVIYIGEVHTSIDDHKIQLAILKKLQERNQCLVIGMEMFPRSDQPVLDRYTRGELTEEQFLAESHWDKVWGFPYQLYKGIIDFALEEHLRVIGLNAPSDVVREIAHKGLGSLSPEARSLVARDFHLDDPINRTRILKEYEAHGKESIRDFQSFYEAQMAWEETMAETIANVLKELDRNCKIVVIAGKGHMTAQLGIPYLANLRVPHEFRTVAPVPLDYPCSACDPQLANYVVLTDKTEPHRRPRLGVKIVETDKGKGVVVLEVSANSVAERAGILKDDIITEVDGAVVNTTQDLMQAIAKGSPTHALSIERKKKKLVIQVKIDR